MKSRSVPVVPATAFLAVGLLVASSSSSLYVSAFSTPIFTATTPKRAPSKTVGVEIELPNFDELFHRIMHVSPLARQIVDREEGGFEAIDDKTSPSDLKWKNTHSNPRNIVHRIDKIENFQNLGCPILRFRASMQGPCISNRFANFIMDLDERKKWDPQIANVENIYPINDLDAANIAIGSKYGDCTTLGVGYCATKPNLVSSSREQLTLCGIQDFTGGASIIWGTEMEDRHNYLFPDGPRFERARSHLFSMVLMPTSSNSFDVEYILQMDCGGKIPTFLTTPVICETVKSMFNHAKKYFAGGEGSDLENWMLEQQEIAMNEYHLLFDRESILMPF
eukprot:CAMPEP_0195518720 /NCGR_PEP_ID=MMETSP0794_2-20130614/13558_1 /TAXON_ID=515487 /ORGANISM="Stephanopyxis turris, Strain CCMP 815" /LENGTH=335 /DNA_ID=CAMNT_0040647741 /DNA_START=139 /DNA_END=1146 /DNA_ORIENTATION=+